MPAMQCKHLRGPD
jgi:hypothetical protein